MPRLIHLASAAALVAAAACSEPTAPARPPTSAPVATIADAAHAGGPSHFYFLPPTVKAPASFGGTFDAALQPRVEVCELSGPVCGATVATFVSGGTGPDAVKLDAGGEKYHVNFQTQKYSLDPTRTYRITVFQGAIQLGYADLKVVANGGAQKSVDPNQYAVVKNGSTLPIAFRIEAGIAGAVVVSPALDSIPVGQTAQFTATVTDLHGDPLPGAPVVWSSSDPAVATVDVNGLATGVAVGTAIITATSGGASGNATLVVVNPNHPPVAAADTFDAIGNVTVPVAAPGVLANDTDPDADALSAVPGSYPTAQGGTITVAADGSFTYLSAAGFTGSDSAPYVVTDGAAADTGQVVLNVASRVWYVQNTAAAPGDGRDASPFATLAQAASASTAGETIFVLFGDGGTAGLDAGITLQAGQSLIGQGVSAPVVVALNGAPLVLLAAGSSPLLTRATSGTTVQLATNNTVRGLYVTSSDGTGIAGTGFSTLQASDLSVAAQGGPALNLQNGTVAANLRTVSSSGSATAGLALASVSGAFTVWGDGTTAASGGTIQGTGGDAVSLSGPASVTLRLMRILPLHSGIVASSASGPLTVERSTIDYQGSAPAGIAYGVRFASAGGSAALVLDGTTVSNKLDASPAVSVSATGNATLSFTMRDGNTGDGFASRLTNLFGSGVAVSSGDSPGSAAHVTARVSGTSFDNAAPNGTNNLELGVAQLAVLDYVVSGNTFDAVAKASAVAGVINLSAFDSGRFGSTTAADSIVGNTVQNVGTGAAATQLGYVGIRVALDNAVPGINQRVVIEGNDIHNLWRQGVLISGRGNANDINVRLAGNTIGTVGAPVARSNRRAVEVEAQNNSTVKIEVLNNPSIENTSTSGANSALAIRSTATTSTVAATVVGNVIGNTNGAITAGRFRAETLAGTTAGMCLDLRSNTLDASASLFELIAASAGAFKVRGPGAAVVTGPDVTAANTVGTGSVSGAPTFNGNVACAAPTL